MAKTGRPSKYSKRMAAKAREYLKTYKDSGHVIPTAAGLSLYLELNKDTLYDWAHKFSEFSVVMKELKSRQEEELIEGSLTGKYNSTIAKLILHKHDYSERKDVDITSNGKSIESVQREIVK